MKIVMIKAMSDSCHFCRKMEREVMIDKDVIAAIEKIFIAVSIDENQKMLMNVAGAWSKNDFISLSHESKLSNQKDKYEKK